MASSSSKSDYIAEGVKAYDLFDEMALPEDLERGIYAFGFEKPSKPQRLAIMPMKERHDILCQSQSGTGKTGAFAIGACSSVDPTIQAPQILVLCHTRELSQQTEKVVRGIGQFMKLSEHQTGLEVLSATGGTAVGRANGLSVTLFGDYEFGLPHQISCTVGVGHGGILDLEREAQLGGPIHTKGMMIIKSYLVRLFAQDKPIVLTGSLCFEQNYAGVEGDSASGAELAALLSALSGAPIDLSLAFTGAVSQSGAIMAVGGVSRKVEGFFEVCRRRGLTGRQGVLFPADNAVHLMLKDEVVEAVAGGRFHLYPVATIEQAMTILTGRPAGARRKDGRYPPGSLYQMVDARLAELTRLAASAEFPRKRRS